MDSYGNVEAGKRDNNHQKKKVEILVNTLYRYVPHLLWLLFILLFSHLSKGLLNQGCYELKKSTLL